MHLHINHMFCQNPTIGEGNYTCSYLVSIERFDSVEDARTNTPTSDWDRVISYVNCLCPYDVEVLGDRAIARPCPQLSLPVITWLNERVKPRPKAGYDGYIEGWATDKPSAYHRTSKNIFFHRKRDALDFIRLWSDAGQPTSYCDYFRDVRWKLVDGIQESY